MKLTSREREILKLMTFSNQYIAKKLNIQLSTVKAHVHNILLKMDCVDRANCLVKAIKMGIISVFEVSNDTTRDYNG